MLVATHHLSDYKSNICLNLPSKFMKRIVEWQNWNQSLICLPEKYLNQIKQANEIPIALFKDHG